MRSFVGFVSPARPMLRRIAAIRSRSGVSSSRRRSSLATARRTAANAGQTGQRLATSSRTGVSTSGGACRI